MAKSRTNEVTPSSKSKSAMVAASKSSHVISNSYSAAKGEGKSSQYSQHNNIIPPTIRVVYVYEPKIIKIDPQNFRSVVQRLTGKPTDKSMENKKHANTKSPSSEVISAEAGPEDFHDDTFYSNDQLSMGESTSTKFSTDNCFYHCNGLRDTDIIFPGLGYQGLLHEIPLVRNNSPFCNVYDQAEVYRCT